MDFYHPPFGLVLQVDDPHHFYTHTIHQYQRGQILSKDLTFNKLCWDQGKPLLRVACSDLGIVGPVVACVLKCIQERGIPPSMCLMVLAPSYAIVKLGEISCYGDGQGMYIQECEQVLGFAPRAPAGAWGSLWFVK